MRSRRMALHWKIVIGLVLGVVAGAILNQWWTTDTWSVLGVADPSAYLAGRESEVNAQSGSLAAGCRFAVNLTKFAGDAFLRALRFIAVPITLCALTVGVASLGDIRKLGRLGGRTLALFLATTVISIGIGLGLSGTVKPGHFVSEDKRSALAEQRAADATARIATARQEAPRLSMWERLVAVVPVNPFDALARADMLQIVFMSVAIGIGLTLIPREVSDPVVRVLDGIAGAIIQLVRILMSLAPYAVFALIAPIVAGIGFDVLGALGVYCLVVVGGLALIGVVVYPVMLWILTPRGNRVGPGRFYRAVSPAMLVAFSSSSSNATLPVTIGCVRDRLGVSADVANFVCPLGATINMNGTALYQAVATTFLAQLYGIDLTAGDLLAVVAMATMSAIGAAGVPGASIVLLVMVLQAVHIPPDGIAIILAVDRVLDMCRTVTNITGDAAVAAVVASAEGGLSAEPEPALSEQ